MSRPIVLDTDIGTDVDDAIALALVLASPELDLRGVSIVSGDVGRRGQIAQRLLAAARRADIRVTLGVREPVMRQRQFLWLGHEGQGVVEYDAPVPAAVPHAVDALGEQLRAEPMDVVAIGPLSNLAVAIMKDASVIERVLHLTVMGGALGFGPTSPLVEYNLASDPEAAVVTLSSGMPSSLVPLDVTQQVYLTQGEVDRLRRSTAPVVQLLCNAIDVWAPLQRMALGDTIACEAVAFLHDPLTIGALLQPALLTWEVRHLQPAIEDGLFRLVADAAGPAIRVATAVDAPQFVAFLMERLLRLD